jgi:biotin synthase
MNMPLEEILEYVRAFMRQKVNGICVMATADYDFQRYLDVIAAVRKETGGETPLMVNIADFDYSQALELKNAGIRSIYHAVRMGEGVVNKAEIEIRFKTMIAAKEAGILLGAGVEMIAPAYADKDVVQIMQRQIDLEPHMAGCKARIRVPGTKMEKTPTYIKAKHDLYAASYRLLISTAAPFCAENCRWSSR